MSDTDIRRLVRHAGRRAQFPAAARCIDCDNGNPAELVADRVPLRCYRCTAVRFSRAPVEQHHWAGQHNARETITMDANDHRTLSDLQQDWPRETLRNPEGSPLLAAEGRCLGFLDHLRLIIERLRAIPTLVHRLHQWFLGKYGPRYWEHPDCAWVFAGLQL